MHAEEVNRKGGLYGYEQDEIVIIPNAIDFTEYYHPAAKTVVEQAGLTGRDIVALYPCRLDRGKQPHIILEVFRELERMRYDTKVVIADFHSVDGDKAAYRASMKADYGSLVFFTSDLEGVESGAPFNYCLPHQAIMDLFDFADVLMHPSQSECDPLIVPEAIWKRCGLILNFDLPLFRRYDGDALLYKFSSAIDTNTGMPGNTETSYGNRSDYMRHVAAGIAYQMENNPVLKLHARMRKERSLEAVGRSLWAAIES